jgi:integrase
VVQARVKDGDGKTRLKQQTLPTGTTLGQAVVSRAKLVEQVRAQIMEGEGLQVPTLGVYAARWIERRAREGLRGHTLNMYLSTLEKHILPFLGGYKVDELGPRHILAWKDEAQGRTLEGGKQYAAWSVNSWFSVLRNILGDAAVEYELPRNPCDGVHGVKKPRAPRGQRYLTAVQLRKFLRLVKAHCPQHYGITLVLAMLGLRWSEASGLHREHVDSEAMEIRVVQSHVRQKLHATKNEDIKVLPISPEILAAIDANDELLRVRKNPGLEKGILFPARNGDYRFPSSVSKGWLKVSNAMKLGWCVAPHDLRRSYQNLLRQAGAGQVVQQALMGHSSDSMTLHYSHVAMAEKRRAHEDVISLLQYKDKKASEG